MSRSRILPNPAGPILTSGAGPAEVAALMLQLAADTRNRHLRAAARWLESAKGRKVKDGDETALRDMRDLLETGEAKSVEDAARRIARTLGGQSLTANEARLARKYRKALSGKNSSDEMN